MNGERERENYAIAPVKYHQVFRAEEFKILAALKLTHGMSISALISAKMNFINTMITCISIYNSNSVDGYIVHVRTFSRHVK